MWGSGPALDRGEGLDRQLDSGPDPELGVTGTYINGGWIPEPD